MTQAEAARFIGVSIRQIKAWESGENAPCHFVAARVADFCGVYRGGQPIEHRRRKIRHARQQVEEVSDRNGNSAHNAPIVASGGQESTATNLHTHGGRR